MVHILARDVFLCLILDVYGDHDVVQSFVHTSWGSLKLAQLPSTLRMILWLWRLLRAQHEEYAKAADQTQSGAVASGTVWRSSNDGETSAVVGAGVDTDTTCCLSSTPVTDVVASLSVQEVLNHIKSAPPLRSMKELKTIEKVCNEGSAEGVDDVVEAVDLNVQCRSAEELWALTRLTALVRHAVALLTQQLLPLLGPAKDQTHNLAGEGKVNEPNHKLFAEFPHECVVLVPLDVCRTVRGFSLRQIVNMCSRRGRGLSTNGGHSCSISIIINPALPSSDNPHRSEKNRRLDKIQQARLAQHYESMVSTCKSQGGDPSFTGLSRCQQTQQQQKKESFSSFIRDASIGFDVQLMALCGGGVGYYLAYVRGCSANDCIVYAIVGLITMLFVDAILLILMLRRQDEKLHKERRRRSRWFRSESRQEKQRQREECLAGGYGDFSPEMLQSKKNA
uniref:Transmembrane protein n=1 Tax=Trypanosoma congolense (strain IL3000) TaxID=1068625 RepID=G0UN62_TRYCI|nr:conserved hypothetical protein [Trypanosoma congolense IL3000]